MKKLFVFAMVAVSLTIFNGCQKEELNIRQLADEVQPQEMVKPDVYVENGYLAFKDFETLIALQKELNNMSIEKFQSFETKMGYKSAFSYRKSLLEKADELAELELLKYLDEVSKKGYFNKQQKEFVYPFYNESYAKILNPKGKVKIGKTFYKFEQTTEIITPDLTGMEEYSGDPEGLKKVIHLDDTGLSQLKSGEMLKETMLRDDRLRCLLQLKREQYDVYDWILDPFDGMVWGFVGTKWDVYYRFYSYKQFSLYKSDRPTYFNWKTKQSKIGGNNGYWHQDYYNPNPPTERSTEEAAIIHFPIYWTALTQSQYSPNVYAVQVSDFWSDYMSTFHGSLIYP